MSSSTEAPLTSRGAVLRDADVRPAALDRDLSDLTRLAFDPARAEAAIADGYRDGFAAGHAEGFAAGRAEGLAAGEAQAESVRQQLNGVLMRLRDELHAIRRREDDLLRNVEHSIAEAALALATSIIGHEVASAADPGRDAIARALALVPTGIASATARLHPDDAARLGSLADLHLAEVISVVADADVEPGGCVLTAGDATIDTQLGPALARARARLLGSEA